jgi:hypothetical protein
MKKMMVKVIGERLKRETGGRWGLSRDLPPHDDQHGIVHFLLHSS